MAATVVNNLDTLNLGRVQIQIPGAVNMPWARVASPMAGLMRGFYAMPQIGDEVLVAFGRGDTEEPYIIGSLWNGVDRPPTLKPTDAVNKRVIRTLAGHEIDFDDATQTLTITSSTQQKVTMRPDAIEMAAGIDMASVKLETTGRITLSAKVQIDIDAPLVTIGGDKVDIEGRADLSMGGGPHCAIKAGLVEIN